MKLKTIKYEHRWQSYCLYCDKDITPPDGHTKIGFFDCFNCPISVRFLVYGDVTAPEIGYIHLRTYNHLIELNYYDNRLILWAEHTTRSKKIMELDHIPEITPPTASQWIERMYKIKAFS